MCDSVSVCADSSSMRVWQQQRACVTAAVCVCDSVSVCDSVCVGVKAETGRAAVSVPAWDWEAGTRGSESEG